MNNNQVLWQQYIDVFIGDKCNSAIIFNKADGSKWRHRSQHARNTLLLRGTNILLLNSAMGCYSWL